MPVLSNVNGIIESLKIPGGCQIARKSEPIQNAYGTYTAAAETIINVPKCVIHNLGGRDLEQLPEANRTRETIQIYTYIRLYVADGGKDADIVIYRGRRFKVIRVMDYDLQGACYISIAQLEEENA